ncbi:hypothetical protein MSG28_015118 [Choristoneura fumiferana]|uniref:Uncharacterized protein n=1 Tax=Choristoneura fumiferana TaxID=7141 RepID=A0ACC0KZ31_CHOFU|nr:hypothetical protein MSG28_015118 [Choristoneura fumiferana]
MTYYCSQCSFSSNFESALLMHQQLHHESPCTLSYPVNDANLKAKSHTMPRAMQPELESKPEREIKLLGRTSSATRLFDRLRARICRSRTLFSHPEETGEDLSLPSECTSKAFKEEDSPLLTKRSVLPEKDAVKETFVCHLCTFEADRITVLDRHLLNDHKIGMDNLLKLVMAKTKDSLADDPAKDIFGLRQPYYKPQDELEEGEFIVETVTPKVKILKHASTNTENIDLRDNCKMITNELEKLVNSPTEACDKNELLIKMQTLNECMCKFVDSSNMLKRVLTKEFDTKSLKNDRVSGEPFFDLRLGEGDKSKLSSESFYF